MRNIYLIGDSIFGKLKQDDLMYLDIALASKVVNCAYGGASIKDAKTRYRWCKELAKSTFVICIGHNDINEKTPLDEFRAGLNELLNNIGDARAYLLLPPPVDIIIHAREGGQFNNDAKPYLAAYLDTARSYKNITILDFQSKYSSLMKEGIDYHIADGVHLNRKGVKVFAEGLADELNSESR